MNNYLDVLPTEIKLNICSYLQPVDLISFGDAYSSFQNIVTCTKLSKVSIRDYRFNVKHLSNFLCKKPLSEYITKLNISHIYWISRVALKKAIVHLLNLESLFVEGTKLDLNTILSDTLEKLNNIHTISASYNYSKTNFAFDFTKYSKITHLYVYYVQEDNAIYRALAFILPHFIELEMLVILNMKKPFGCCLCDHESDGTGNGVIVLSGGNLKFVFVNDSELNIHPDGAFYVVQNCIEMGYLYANTQSETTNSYYDSFFRNLRFSGKCGRNQPDAISDRRELITCYCSWQADNTNINRKRKHSAELNDEELETNNYVLENIQLHSGCQVEALSRPNSSGLTKLCKWVFLKKLDLRKIPYPNGQPLPQVFQSCTLLESVNFEWDNPSDMFTNFLCKSLKYAQNLKDFRYSIKQIISLVSLLESLTACPKLERAFVECGNKPTNPELLLKTLLALVVKPDVIFVGVVMDIAQHVASNIQKEVGKIINSNKKKVFLFESKFKPCLKNYIYKTVPIEHVKDMIFINPSVCMN